MYFELGYRVRKVSYIEASGTLRKGASNDILRPRENEWFSEVIGA